VAACEKIALGKGQGTQDTQERPTLEAEPRGQLPMRADMCPQLALATMAAGPGRTRRCDNPSCNAALQIEPVLNNGYVAPSFWFHSISGAVQGTPRVNMQTWKRLSIGMGVVANFSVLCCVLPCRSKWVRHLECQAP
jgi:hypothetical protein